MIETEVKIKITKRVEKNNSGEFLIILHGGADRELYETGQKLTLFPDGSLSSSWCNN